ncbi:MAG: hypothetical protein ACLQVW_25775 [Limisphaerales bacterium]
MTRKTKSPRQKTPRNTLDKAHNRHAGGRQPLAEPGQEEPTHNPAEDTQPLLSGSESPVLQPVLPQATQKPLNPQNQARATPTEEKTEASDEEQNRNDHAQPRSESPLAETQPDPVIHAAADELPSADGTREAIAKARSIEWQLRGPNSQDQAARQMEELNGVLETILGHLGNHAVQLQSQEARLSDLHRQLSDLEGSVNSDRTSR